MTQQERNWPALKLCLVEDRASGRDAEAFFAFFELGGRLHSVHRRFNLDLPGLSHAPGRYQSEILLSTYDEDLRRTGQELLCPGEDPRVVSDGRRAFVLCHRFDAEEGGKGGYSLCILPERTLVDLQAPPGLPLGKNWQPLLIDGRLHAVHGFAPFTLLAIGETGRVEIVRQSPTDYGLPAPHDGFTMVRGGSNALAVGEGFVGLGHLTSLPDEHRPFLWSWRDGRHLGLTLPAGCFGLREKGFNIVDPTSLFRFRDRLYLGLCASERGWFHAQRFARLLIELPADALDRADRFCELVSADIAPTLATSRTFIPARLPHAVPRRVTDDGVESLGQPGHIVHGPYLPIDRLGESLVELTDSATADVAAPRRIGVCDVTLDGDSGFECLGEAALPGTRGAIRTLRLMIPPRACPGARLETRVWAEEGCILRVFNLRMIERSSTDAAIEGEA